MIMSLAISDCVGPSSPVPLKGNLLQCMDYAKRLGYEGSRAAYEKRKIKRLL